MTNEIKATQTRADLFREINKQLRRAEREADERRRREYKPAHTRPTSTTTTRSGHAQTLRHYC